MKRHLSLFIQSLIFFSLSLNLFSQELIAEKYSDQILDETELRTTTDKVIGLIESNSLDSIIALFPKPISVNISKNQVSQLVGKINDLIHANTDYSKFITFFYGDLDLKEKTFKFSNAGHNPPYLLRANGEMETLIEGGLLLGMMPDVHYEEREISLGEGDCILMFTDGVTEAMDENENEFGEENVAKILADNRTLNAASIIEKITCAVKEFVKDNPQSDDITLVAIKVEP